IREGIFRAFGEPSISWSIVGSGPSPNGEFDWQAAVTLIKLQPCAIFNASLSTALQGSASDHLGSAWSNGLEAEFVVDDVLAVSGGADRRYSFTEGTWDVSGHAAVRVLLDLSGQSSTE